MMDTASDPDFDHTQPAEGDRETLDEALGGQRKGPPNRAGVSSQPLAEEEERTQPKEAGEPSH
jgi:hypothetical protein